MKKFSLIFVLILIFTITSLYAQKLPNVQQNSLRAPINTKIDGKATEWNDQFQAYNKATDIFYTIANDDNRLYLIVQATDPEIVKKITAGGISIIINNTGKKTDKNSVVVTFPLYSGKGMPFSINLKNKTPLTNNVITDKIHADSFINVLNKRLADSLKFIGVIGVKSIADSVVSVYNTEGIKVAMLFNAKTNLTYELAVPLKYLGISITDRPKFSYQIKLNGAQAHNATVQLVPSGRFYLVTAGKSNYLIQATPQNAAFAYATDFWGEYILAN